MKIKRAYRPAVVFEKEIIVQKKSVRSYIDDPFDFDEKAFRWDFFRDLGITIVIGISVGCVLMFVLDYFGLLNWLKL